MNLIRITDKVALEVDGLRIVASPINYEKKIEIDRFTYMDGGDLKQDFAKFLFYLIKYSVKELTGFKLAGDRDLVLECDANKTLTDSSAQDVLNVIMSDKRLLRPMMEIGTCQLPEKQKGVKVILNPN